MHTPYNKDFHNHKHSAKVRGIRFLFSFEEWLGFWKASGFLHLRGRGRDQYCMARIGDKGAYKIGNVRIITAAQNRAEMKLSKSTREKMRAAKIGRKLSAEHRAKIAASNTGKKMSPEAVVNLSRCKLGKKNPMYGRPVTVETRARLSAALRARHARERELRA